MNGSEFVARYHDATLPAWEAAAFQLASNGELTPWPFVDLPLSSADGDTAVLKVQTDVLSIGPEADHVRLPMTPSGAQNILNLSGALLPTPWLVYQIWRAAQVKLVPTPMAPNRGANLQQFAAHSTLIDGQLGSGRSGQLVAGHKKSVVISNIYQRGKVLIFGWYKPSPDVYDNGLPMSNPNRQPIQPKSNVHGDFYVDYSHGIRAIGPQAIVNGQPMSTVDLYQHPTLSRLVSNEGPVKVPRYPSSVPPFQNRPVHATEYPILLDVVATTPGASELGFDLLTRRNG